MQQRLAVVSATIIGLIICLAGHGDALSSLSTQKKDHVADVAGSKQKQLAASRAKTSSGKQGSTEKTDPDVLNTEKKAVDGLSDLFDSLEGGTDWEDLESEDVDSAFNALSSGVADHLKEDYDWHLDAGQFEKEIKENHKDDDSQDAKFLALSNLLKLLAKVVDPDSPAVSYEKLGIDCPKLGTAGVSALQIRRCRARALLQQAKAKRKADADSGNKPGV